MAATTTVRNPYNVQRQAGSRIKPEHQSVLDLVSRRLHEQGVEVLSTLFCRTYGFLTFFATAYRPDQITDRLAAPLGCVRVSFLRNGEVSVNVMGVLHGSYDVPHPDIQWQ